MADEENKKVTVTLREDELFAASEFFNNEGYAMPDHLYRLVGVKLMVAAAKAGLYDDTEWSA
jgi:hypothetical protein